LFVVDAESGSPTRIAALRVSADAFAWSPDGSRIAFASGMYGSRRILVMDADGSRLRALLGEDGDALSTVAAP
jgi:Tol biopolymer transport system component